MDTDTMFLVKYLHIKLKNILNYHLLWTKRFYLWDACLGQHTQMSSFNTTHNNTQGKKLQDC